MDTTPLSRSVLKEIASESRTLQKKNKIDALLREIKGNVVSYAKKGYETYKYVGCAKIQDILESVMTGLKELFPDSDIHYSVQSESEQDAIVINWS